MFAFLLVGWGRSEGGGGARNSPKIKKSASPDVRGRCEEKHAGLAAAQPKPGEAAAFIHHTLNDSAAFVQKNRQGYLNCYVQFTPAEAE
jgi:hypothetical protein